ncbi:coiled-coil domain-containing protein 81-like [Polyodon spathula]|uniref:coiled-coil domain-containing protein 81-like n=1 Tax=Polyodon spathula TaxID=7913 RepID=UPI001B7E8528|nr:coiled-coil domain-containing protein 81-like [Polyodon spathula]
MIETLISGNLETGKSSFPTLSRISDNDVDSIWTNVSAFVERQMSLQKGVSIPGLGTFTFSQQKLDVGNKTILIQRPIFLISEKFAQTHGLKQTKLFCAGDVPVVQLNFTSLSLESPFDRDTVEGCVRETLLLLSRSIAFKRSVLFYFHGIGVISIREGKVKMKFYRDFLNSMDGSGSLVKALSNRPGTCDSVLTARESQARPVTSNTVLLPRIHLGQLGMETVPEEGKEMATGGEGEEEKVTEEPVKGEPLSNRQLPSRQTLTPARVTGISVPDDLERSIKNTAPVERLISPVPPPAVNDTEQQGSTPPPSKRAVSTPVTACADHCRAGQELCYLCMQRARRNVPVYFHEERKRQQEDEERVLMQYQQLKDQAYLDKKQNDMLAARENNKKSAAYNLGVSEAIKASKTAKPTFSSSYIFPKRPGTLCRFPRQEEYKQSLSLQVEAKKEKEAKSKQDQESLDRLELTQLAEDLAAQTEQHLRNKAEKTMNYQKALDAQVKTKAHGLPSVEPNLEDPIFGSTVWTDEKLLEQRRRAHELYRYQLEVSAKKRRDALLNRIVEQKKEQDMLERNRKELIADRVAHYDKLRSWRASLEETWAKTAEAKRQRDLEEEQFRKSGSHLLLEQCQKYGRCYRCKRRTTNCGESNIWMESRYIPGSRLMI